MKRAPVFPHRFFGMDPKCGVPDRDPSTYDRSEAVAVEFYAV